MRIERAAGYILAFGLMNAGACVDPMIVGERPACEMECPSGLHCDVDLQRCVQCKVDEDCAERPNAPYCEGFGCVQCRTLADCTDARMCSAGACLECIEDSDCNTGLEPFEVHLCRFGSCVDQRR